MGGDVTSPVEAREEGRRAALAGRAIYANPHLGEVAEEWFAGYRDVPEAARGSRPELRQTSRVRRKRKPRGLAIGMSGAGVKALGDKCLKGSTPRPWTEPVS